MPLSTTPSLDTPRPPPIGEAVARKARFWDLIARKCAADPMADLPGYEATLRRVQDLLTQEMNGLESAGAPAAPRCGWRRSRGGCWPPMCRLAWSP